MCEALDNHQKHTGQHGIAIGGGYVMSASAPTQSSSALSTAGLPALLYGRPILHKAYSLHTFMHPFIYCHPKDASNMHTAVPTHTLQLLTFVIASFGRVPAKLNTNC